jgi:hypothetical protein
MNWNESMDRVNRDEPQQCFKLVAIDSEGRYVSIFDGTTEYKVGETITQEVRAGECAGSSWSCSSKRAAHENVRVCMH